MEIAIKRLVAELAERYSHEEILYNSCVTFTKLFSIPNVFLFRYSPFGFVAEGVLSLQQGAYLPIQDVRDDIRSLPSLYAAVRRNEAQFYEGTAFLLNNSMSKYKQGLHNTLIVPISNNNTVIGYFISIDLDPSLITSAFLQNTLSFGKEIGRVISFGEKPIDGLLTKREFEVMQLIANGESTKAIMGILHLSEPTIKQYVKSAMVKLEAVNRTHAVSELYRKGLLL